MLPAWTPETVCAHEGCDNRADPRWAAYCKHGNIHYVCDGHVPTEGNEPEEHPWTPYVDPCGCGEATT